MMQKRRLSAPMEHAILTQSPFGTKTSRPMSFSIHATLCRSAMRCFVATVWRGNPSRRSPTRLVRAGRLFINQARRSKCKAFLGCCPKNEAQNVPINAQMRSWTLWHSGKRRQMLKNLSARPSGTALGSRSIPGRLNGLWHGAKKNDRRRGRNHELFFFGSHLSVRAI